MLRQGGPLSPSLFVLVIEVLSRLISREEVMGCIHGIQIARYAPPIANLFFADDVMLFCRANAREVRTIDNYLRKFATWSRQSINHNNSFLHFSNNLSPERRTQLALLLKEGGKYLGLPLFILRSKTQACQKCRRRWLSA